MGTAIVAGLAWIAANATTIYAVTAVAAVAYAAVTIPAALDAPDQQQLTPYDKTQLQQEEATQTPVLGSKDEDKKKTLKSSFVKELAATPIVSGASILGGTTPEITEPTEVAGVKL